MALPPVVVATLQATALAGLSNVLAQVLTSYRKEVDGLIHTSIVDLPDQKY
jgi:hypothetical protein